MTIDRAIEIMAGSADVDYAEWAQARKMGMDALREKKERMELRSMDADKRKDMTDEPEEPAAEPGQGAGQAEPEGLIWIE